MASTFSPSLSRLKPTSASQLMQPAMLDMTVRSAIVAAATRKADNAVMMECYFQMMAGDSSSMDQYAPATSW
jgi:hypothetical protein